MSPANRATTPDTLFRIGSTSKAFASLSILKLANEGKLSLQDPVRKLVPEVWFQNRWEASDPVRVVDLLEHTTGWDDMHLREYAKDAPEEWACAKRSTTTTTRAFRAGGRAPAWPTATPARRLPLTSSRRSPASDSKITCSKNFFVPIGMKTATYFPADLGEAHDALSRRRQDSLSLLEHPLAARRVRSTPPPTTWRPTSSSISIAAR